MNLRPLLGFWWKHGDQVDALFSAGAGDGSLFPDIVNAAVPVLKKHWPALNANGLLDDAVATLKEVLAPPAPPQDM